MSLEFIQFKKQRELGEIINSMFKFLRENYKEFGKILIKIAGPALILLVVALSYYSYNTLGTNFSNFFSGSGEFFISAIVMLLAYFFYTVTFTGTAYHIIKSYVKNDGQIIATEVSSGMKKDLGKLILLGFLSAIMIFAGSMLFLIPGIYLSVPLSLASAILVFRSDDVMESISESFQLIKNNWWITFFTLIVIWLLIYIISMVFQLPAIIYMFIKAFTVVQEGSSADPSSMFDGVYLVISIIASVIQYILYCIIPVGVAFIYFNLNEKKNFTGTYETIENLGKNT